MAAAGRGDPGGIAALVDLIDEHRPAFCYDWRARFGVPLRDALDGAPDWAETSALVSELAADPSSHAAAALAGWTHAWPIEAWILADLADITIRANSTRTPSRYPRPSDKPAARLGSTGRPQREILAALAARGHDTEAPDGD